MEGFNMKKLLIILLATSLLSSPAHGMWNAFTTRVASAAQYARAKMSTFAQLAPKVSAKPMQKLFAQTKAQSNGNESSWWQSLSENFSSAWNSLKKNFKIPQWLKSSTTQEQIKKTYKANSQTVLVHAPMLNTALAATTVAAQAYTNDDDAQFMPTFTANNIFKYRLHTQHRSAFIAHAVKNITSKNAKTIETIVAILEQYPDSHVAITQAALDVFNDVQPVVLKEILAYNAWAKDEFVKKLITQDSPHLDKLFKNYIASSSERNMQYNWFIGNGEGAQIGITHHILNTIIKKPQICSVLSFNTIFAHISSKFSLYLIGLNFILRKAAIKHYGQDAATMIALLDGRIQFSNITEKPICVYSPVTDAASISLTNGINIEEAYKAALREMNTLSVQDIDSIYQILMRKFFNGPFFEWHHLNLTENIRKAAKKRFEPYIVQHRPSLQELIYIHSYTQTLLGDREYSLPMPAILKYPACAYIQNTNLHLHTPDSLIREIHRNLYADLESIPASYFEYIHDKILDSKTEKQEFREKITPLIKDTLPPLYSRHILNAAMQGYDNGIPSFLTSCTPNNHQATHSEKHFCANIQLVIQQIFKNLSIKRKTNAIPLFKRAIAKEREELAKGNHVFYHGRQWQWDFVADIYKGLYNATRNSDEAVANNYTFLRFDASRSVYANGANDGLFLNAPLFGNTKWWGNSTAQLILKSYDWSRGKSAQYTPATFFKQFNIDSHYTKYKTELAILESLHQKANPNNLGSLLVVSIDDKHIDKVYSAQTYVGHKKPITLSTGESTLDTKRILSELKAGKLPNGGDSIEYILPLDKDYALNPKEGPRIYSLNACDPVKYKEYIDYRDQLFAKIKADIDKAGGTK